MLKIVQQFGVRDKFDLFYQIAQVEYENLPSWVEPFIARVSQTNIRFALDRYADPLVRELRYTPKEVLDRVPTEHKKCQIWDTCASRRELECLNMKKNVCRVYEAPAPTPEQRVELTDLMNLWRDGWNVVTVEPDSQQ